MPDTRKFTIQERLKKYVHIQIQDNGNGFYVDNKEKLFSPFYTTKQQGTGMGLALVAKILDTHHAYYDIVSETNGTTFSIWLPVS